MSCHVRRDGLDDAGEIIAQDKRRETPASFGIVVLMFALRVENVGVLGTAVGDADEELVGLRDRLGDLDRFEQGWIGNEFGDEDGFHLL